MLVAGNSNLHQKIPKISSSHMLRREIQICTAATPNKSTFKIDFLLVWRWSFAWHFARSRSSTCWPFHLHRWILSLQHHWWNDLRRRNRQRFLPRRQRRPNDLQRRKWRSCKNPTSNSKFFSLKNWYFFRLWLAWLVGALVAEDGWNQAYTPKLPLSPIGLKKLWLQILIWISIKNGFPEKNKVFSIDNKHANKSPKKLWILNEKLFRF